MEVMEAMDYMVGMEDTAMVVMATVDMGKATAKDMVEVTAKDMVAGIRGPQMRMHRYITPFQSITLPVLWSTMPVQLLTLLQCITLPALWSTMPVQLFM